MRPIKRGTKPSSLMILSLCSSLLITGCEEDSPPPSGDPNLADEGGGAPVQAPQAGLSAEPQGGAAGEQIAGALSPSGGAAHGGQGSGGGEPMTGGEAGVAGAGLQAGQSIPVPPPEEEEVSCLRSCVDFVECAIESCEGYGEEDTSLLMNECLSVCIDPIARAFDRLKNCEDKLRFAFTVRPDFSEFCDSVSEGFCETYLATCGEWLGEGPCEPHYNDAPQSGPDLTSGAHRTCYEYHLGAAMRALERGDDAGVIEGCERAAGRSVCVEGAP